MRLAAQTLDIPFTGGVRQDIDARVLPAGSFARAENAVFDKAGAIKKRGGYGAMTLTTNTADLLGSVASLAVDGDALYAVDHRTQWAGLGKVFSYTLTRNAWVSLGNSHRVSPVVAPIVRGPQGAFNGFVCEANGIRWQLWYALRAGVYFRGTDIATGAVVYQTAVAVSQTSTVKSVVYCLCGDDIVIAVSRATLTDIQIYFLDTSYGVVSTHSGVAALPFTSGHVATCMVAYDATHFLIGGTTSSIPGFLILADASNPGLYDSITFGVTTAVDRVAFAVDGSDIFLLSRGGSWTANVAYYWRFAAGGSLSHVYGPFLAGTAADVQGGERLSVTLRDNGDPLYVWGDGTNLRARGTVAATGALYDAATVLLVPNAYLASHAFTLDGVAYAAVFVFPTLETVGVLERIATVMLVALDLEMTNTVAGDGPAPAAVLVRARGAYVADTYDLLPAAVTLPDDTRALFAATVLAQGALGGGAVNAGVDSIEVDVSPGQVAMQSYALAAGLVTFAGGLVLATDGESLAENGFVHSPDMSISTGAGTIPQGAYSYAAVYGWYDARGNLHRSTPSIHAVNTTALGSPQDHTVLLRTLALTRRENVFIELYRSLADTPGTYYRLSTPMAADLINDPAAAYLTYVDTLTDTQLLALGYGTLYTDGGVLDNVQPPAARCVVSHKNRLWLASAEDRREIWYSKPLVGGRPPEFNDGQVIRLDDASEPITAIASLDAMLVVFTASRIYYIAGDGPTQTGQGSFFSDPQRVQSDAGCDDPRSLAALDKGVLYRSGNGICLLGRSLETSFAGAPVKTEAELFPTSLGVVVDAARGRVYCVVATDNLATWRVLVLDTEHTLWTTWNIGGIESDAPCRAHALWRGQHVIAGDDGVFLEGYGTRPGYDPGPTWVTSTVRTPWIHPGGVAGFQRVWRVHLTGERLSSCNALVGLYSDYGDAPDALRSFDLTDATGSTRGLPVVRLQLGVPRQKCGAIMIEISDSEDTESESDAAVTGFDLVSVSLELGIKPGGARLPAVNRGLPPWPNGMTMRWASERAASIPRASTATTRQKARSRARFRARRRWLRPTRATTFTAARRIWRACTAARSNTTRTAPITARATRSTGRTRTPTRPTQARRARSNRASPTNTACSSTRARARALPRRRCAPASGKPWRRGRTSRRMPGRTKPRSRSARRCKPKRKAGSSRRNRGASCARKR